jgi:hypothetical protein
VDNSDVKRAAQLLVERRIELSRRRNIKRALQRLDAVPTSVINSLARGYRDPYEAFVTACMDAAKYERLKRMVCRT